MKTAILNTIKGYDSIECFLFGNCRFVQQISHIKYVKKCDI